MYSHFLTLNKIRNKKSLGFLLIFSLIFYTGFPAIYHTYAEGEESAPAPVVPPPAPEPAPAPEPTPPAPPTSEAVGEPTESVGSELPPPPEETVPVDEVVEEPTENVEVEEPSIETEEQLAPESEDVQDQAENVEVEETPTEPEEETVPTNMASTTIDTGNAVASTDLTNVINTNTVNSEGGIVAGSGSLGDASLDLRDDLGSTSQSSSGSSSGSSCATCTNNISINGNNVATTTNDLFLLASTGNNTASSTSDGSITTGNAYAGANVVNVVNTNIIDSNYLLLVFNNMGEWSGDIIFPNGAFFSQFLSSLLMKNCESCGGSLSITDNNEANVSNSVTNSTESGNNTASGTDASINTGDALSSTNIYNQVNENVTNSSSFYLIIKVLGEWTGNIFNLPEGISWKNTNEGIMLYSSDNEPMFSSVNGGNTSIENSNGAIVENNVSLSANTGDNTVNASGNASIQTGNAYTALNMANVVNTNIVSSNWIRAFINVLGDWSGNVSFGQPDLWIGSRIESAGPIDPGEMVTVYTTIANRGDAPAHNVSFSHFLNDSYLSFPSETDPVRTVKEMPLLGAGETKEYIYKILVSNDVPQGDNVLESSLSVQATESDGNLDDNSDTLAMNVNYHPVFVSPLNLTSYTTTYPNLSITKTNDSVGAIKASSSVNYTITIKNTGGKAFEGVLIDELKDPQGNVINEQTWDLDTILDGEEITITYTVNFSSSTTAGIYTNFAHVEALGGDYLNHKALASIADSDTVSSSVMVVGSPIPPIITPVYSPIIKKETINVVPIGTLRTGPQSTSTPESSALEFDVPQKKMKIDFKNLLASVFSIILLIRPKRDGEMMTML